MSNDGKLININLDLSGLEGLSDAAKTFSKRISDEVGAFTKPFHTRRMAKAKADAAIIAAEGKNRLSEVQERGLRRMVLEEGRRQENIESISSKALEHIRPDAKADQMDSDWISDFFDKARLVGDEEMQTLWAKLLASEANDPKSVSKRTVAIMASLDKADAQLFTKFCSFVWMIGYPTPLIFEINSGQPSIQGVDFDRIKHLDSIGLVSFEAFAGYVRKGVLKVAQIAYYGRTLLIEFPQGVSELKTGKVMLTETGRQLAGVCGSTPSQEYYLEVVQRFYNDGCTLTSLSAHRSFY